jgi:hypothetical protein
VSSALFALTAIEAYANTAIPDGYTLPAAYQQKWRTDKREAHLTDKEWIECHLGLDKKLRLILPDVLGKLPPAETTDIWKDYEDLKAFRDDRIVHGKTADRIAAEKWRELFEPPPRNFADVAKRIIANFVDEKADHWVNNCPF